MKRIMSRRTVVRQQKIGKINVDSITVKRRVQVNLEDLRALERSGDLKTRIFDEQSGAYVFEPGTPLPPVMEGLIRQLRGVFDLGEDIKGQGIFLWLPETSQHKKVGKRKIRRSTMGTVRIITTIGSDENFTINASAGGKSGSSSVHCSSGEAIKIQLGVGAGADITFDLTRGFRVAPQPGFRPRVVRKHPERRFVICVDFLIDGQKLSRTIKEELIAPQSGSKAIEVPRDVQDVIRQACLHPVTEPSEPPSEKRASQSEIPLLMEIPSEGKEGKFLSEQDAPRLELPSEIEEPSLPPKERCPCEPESPSGGRRFPLPGEWHLPIHQEISRMTRRESHSDSPPEGEAA